MKVIDFDEEEIEIKRKIEKARHNISEVEDLSDFDSKSKKPSKDKGKDDEELEPLTPKAVAREIFSVIFNVIMCFVIVFLITHFIGQRTVVSGESMMDTLYDRDNLIVDKISYRLHDPERFDVIVFPPKEDEGAFYIKRVIGLPGETVRIDSSGNIYINDQILEESYGTDVINNPGNAIDDIHLGEDEFFVLGDNRNNSMDSRWLGPIKGDEITGRAWIRFYPFNKAGLVENIE